MILRFYRRSPIRGVGTYDPAANGGVYEEFNLPSITTAPATLPVEVGSYIAVGALVDRNPSGTRTFNRVSQVPGVSAIYVEQ